MNRGAVTFCLCVTWVSANLYAHTGGVDAHGCHRNEKEDNYHCHHGEYKDREFYSRQAMLDQLEKDRQESQQAPKSIEDRLRELKRLYEQGLMSEDDYRKKREDILGDL